jgi:hypothetical protein
MQTVINRIELFFLDYAILLLSDSSLIRALVARTGKFYRQYKEAIQISTALLICGIAGLVAGRLLVYTGIALQLH